jgi:hypothetical protein
LRIAAAFALLFAFTVVSRPARADSAEPHSAATTNSSRGSASSLRGFDVLVSGGWGASTANILQLKLEPYGSSFGLDFGYTWASGFRLGGYFIDSLGEVVSQHRDPRRGPEDDFITDTSSLNGGLSVGWAVPVYALVLRYTLNFGVTAMRWEIPAQAATRSLSIGDGTSPTVGVHFAPGVALLWPYHWFETGIGYQYLAQVKDTIPSGFLAQLFIGVRL